MHRIILGITLTAAIAMSAATGLAQSPPRATDTPGEACAQMMQGAGVTEEGRKAMQDFMQSERAPQAMANMMAMARRMGDGDAILGMTRMMEMMGGMQGGGMMRDGREPRK